MNTDHGHQPPSQANRWITGLPAPDLPLIVSFSQCFSSEQCWGSGKMFPLFSMCVHSSKNSSFIALLVVIMVTLCRRASHPVAELILSHTYLSCITINYWIIYIKTCLEAMLASCVTHTHLVFCLTCLSFTESQCKAQNGCLVLCPNWKDVQLHKNNPLLLSAWLVTSQISLFMYWDSPTACL